MTVKTLLEGGAYGDPFDQKDVDVILNKINSAMKEIGVKTIPVGSAATPKAGKRSNDMDVIVDEKAILDYFRVKDAKAGRKALHDFFVAKGFETYQSGINVHVVVPIEGSKAQVDVMVVPNAERIAPFHKHDIPDKSPYKGVNKQLMIAFLAKDKNMLWSAWQGLFGRDEQGKKGGFITDNLDEIAKMLIGPGANSNDLRSVEAILSALPKEQSAALIKRAKEDPAWKEQPTESVFHENVARVPSLVRSAMEDPVVAKYADHYVRINKDSSDEKIIGNIQKFMEINPRFPVKSPFFKTALRNKGVSPEAIDALTQARDEFLSTMQVAKNIEKSKATEGTSTWFRDMINIASIR